MTELTCFKAYDIRGQLGINLDEEIAYRIGRAFARALSAETIVIGRDVRASSEALAASLVQAFIVEGCTVLDLGLSGTEEMYFATSHFSADAGVCVTASHNPMDYNGMKMVQRGASPLDPVTDLPEVKTLAEANDFGPKRAGGSVKNIAEDAREAYVERVLSFINISELKPLKILVNAGHGTAGPTFDAIAARLENLGAPLVFERIFHDPDGTFPKGIPNPLLPENRSMTAEAVVEAKADFGVAWDGDFDRCFFFDQDGQFIDGEYLVGLLAEAFLVKSPGAKIIHDPRIIWNTQDVVSQAGGQAIQSRTGHAFIKQAMRSHDAVYGGEMSAHHYFREFAYCDSGMIPWLLVAELVSRKGPLRDLVKQQQKAFPSSGEINFELRDAAGAMSRVRDAYGSEAKAIDETDGMSFDMGDWRFNLRSSNTEPVVRLNVEARGDSGLVDRSVARIASLLKG